MVALTGGKSFQSESGILASDHLWKNFTHSQPLPTGKQEPTPSEERRGPAGSDNNNYSGETPMDSNLDTRVQLHLLWGNFPSASRAQNVL